LANVEHNYKQQTIGKCRTQLQAANHFVFVLSMLLC